MKNLPLLMEPARPTIRSSSFSSNSRSIMVSGGDESKKTSTYIDESVSNTLNDDLPHLTDMSPTPGHEDADDYFMFSPAAVEEVNLENDETTTRKREQHMSIFATLIDTNIQPAFLVDDNARGLVVEDQPRFRRIRSCETFEHFIKNEIKKNLKDLRNNRKLKRKQQQQQQQQQQHNHHHGNHCDSNVPSLHRCNSCENLTAPIKATSYTSYKRCGIVRRTNRRKTNKRRSLDLTPACSNACTSTSATSDNYSRRSRGRGRLSRNNSWDGSPRLSRWDSGLNNNDRNSRSLSVERSDVAFSFRPKLDRWDSGLQDADLCNISTNDNQRHLLSKASSNSSIEAPPNLPRRHREIKVEEKNENKVNDNNAIDPPIFKSTFHDNENNASDSEGRHPPQQQQQQQVQDQNILPEDCNTNFSPLGKHSKHCSLDVTPKLKKSSRGNSITENDPALSVALSPVTSTNCFK